MDYKVKTLEYRNDLGTVILRNIVVDIEQDQIDLLKDGSLIEDLDYGLNGKDILDAERAVALNFFKTNYQNILAGVHELDKNQIKAIQNYLGLNGLQFAKVIGLDRGSLTNVYKRNSCSHPVQILIIERLGMELGRTGAAKALYNAMCKQSNEGLSEPNEKIGEEISTVRFGSKVA